MKNWGDMIGRGSEWRRWEPHIHAPGTVLKNQFGGGSPWKTYLDNLETVTVISKHYDRWHYMVEKRAGMAKWDIFVRALLQRKTSKAAA
jgi:hypothetical protein